MNVQKEVSEALKDYHGAKIIIAKLAGVSATYVGLALSDETRANWKSTKRILTISMKVIVLIKYIQSYDNEMLSAQLEQQEF